jgi:hypothetical protein
VTEGKTEIDLKFHLEKSRRNLKMNVLKELEGKRTYIMAAALAAWAILGLFLQKTSLEQAITTILEAGALIGIRASFANALAKAKE